MDVVWAAESVRPLQITEKARLELGFCEMDERSRAWAPEKAQASRPHLVENDIFRLWHHLSPTGCSALSRITEEWAARSPFSICERGNLAPSNGYWES